MILFIQYMKLQWVTYTFKLEYILNYFQKKSHSAEQSRIFEQHTVVFLNWMIQHFERIIQFNDSVIHS